jgi:hypothetical protein
MGIREYMRKKSRYCPKLTPDLDPPIHALCSNITRLVLVERKETNSTSINTRAPRYLRASQMARNSYLNIDGETMNLHILLPR